MKKDHQVFVKMPQRDSAITTVQSTTVRRSPRLLDKKDKTPDQVRPSTLRKSPRLARQKSISQEPEDPKSPKSRCNRVSSSAFSENISKKPTKPSNGSRSCGGLTTGSKKSPILENGSDGFSNLRRSSRISDKRNAVGDKKNDFLGKVLKKVSDSDDGSRSCENLSSGLKKSVRNNGVDGSQSLRRSQRLSNQQTVVSECTEKSSGVKCYHLSSNSASKEEAFDSGKGRVGGVDLGENLSVKGKGSMKREAEESEGGNRVVEVSRKRKRDEEGNENENENVQGWTKEQELALQRAYFAAKPTPHFWKKVSKLVLFFSVI